MRYRRIRKWGNSWVIILTSSDAKDFQIFDSEIDIESSLLRFQKERKREEKQKDENRKN